MSSATKKAISSVGIGCLLAACWVEDPRLFVKFGMSGLVILLSLLVWEVFDV